MLQKDIRHIKAFTDSFSNYPVNTLQLFHRSEFNEGHMNNLPFLASQVYKPEKSDKCEFLLPKLSCWKIRQHLAVMIDSPVSLQLHEGKLVFQQRMPMPMAMKVPNVPPLCIMVFPTPPISSLPRMPILQAEKSF